MNLITPDDLLSGAARVWWCGGMVVDVLRGKQNIPRLIKPIGLFSSNCEKRIGQKIAQ